MDRNGISPPAWGSREAIQGTYHINGNIPTCVGQPALARPNRSSVAEYPHLRGAAAEAAAMPPLNRGISPPAWGSPGTLAPGRPQRGNIPTCVGQPNRSRARAFASEEYPHLRGAASSSTAVESYVRGISPPAWGSRLCGAISRQPLGNIPTCVGQPTTETVRPSGIREYPHLRGAAVAPDRMASRAKGISPPAWGSPPTTRERRKRRGNIPTCVGQPAVGGVLSRFRGEYPHLRGAAYLSPKLSAPRGGISPPAWGSHGANDQGAS